MLSARASGTEFRAGLLVLGLSAASGCGLVLDLDPPDRAPFDASIGDATIDGGARDAVADAVADACAVVDVDRCNGVDDDCDGALDEDAECELPRASSACVLGECLVDTCGAGFADCNGAAADGCEVDLATSIESCGACGTRCGRGAVCLEGVCGLRATAIAAGDTHSCAILAGGDLACWGMNTRGQLGDGTTSGRSVPTPVLGVARVTSVAGGFLHTCAIVDRVGLCWGGGSDGQLGDGTTTLAATSPRAVGGVTDAIDIAAGRLHSCAVLGAGAYACWGRNDAGQLGNGSLATTSVPAFSTSPLGRVTAIDAGASFTCALHEDGRVGCFGANGRGQLGTGSLFDFSRPEPALLAEAALQVSLGAAHACARTHSGAVHCWGDNGSGRLGIGDAVVTMSSTPLPVLGVSGALDICAGGSHGCAVLASGDVVCWGDDGFGQLGNGDAGSTGMPGRVAGLTGAVAVACGAQHTCALTASGAIACWGSNVLGQLGDGTMTSSQLPVRVALGS